mgnify:CR=1 FL=1
MSVHITSAVWKLQLDPVSKLILLKFADCANDQGRNAWPAVATVADECGVSERTVQRVLRTLEAAGIISFDDVESRRHSTNTYTITPENGVRIVYLGRRRPRRRGDTPSPPHGRHPDRPTGDTRIAPRATPGSPDPLENRPDPSSFAHARPEDDDNNDRGEALTVQRVVSTVRRTCGPPNGSIRLQIANMVHEGTPAAWFGEACDAAAEQGVRRWAYVRAIIEHWRTDSRDCECRRPGASRDGAEMPPTPDELAEAEAWGKPGIVYAS